VDLCPEYETLGVHKEVALAALDLLYTVVTTLFSAHSPVVLTDWLSTMPATGLSISLQANSQTFSDSLVDPSPRAIDAPFSEVVVVDGGPSRKVVRE
jgi:hypothetical protein